MSNSALLINLVFIFVVVLLLVALIYSVRNDNKKNNIPGVFNQRKLPLHQHEKAEQVE